MANPQLDGGWGFDLARLGLLRQDRLAREAANQQYMGLLGTPMQQYQGEAQGPVMPGQEAPSFAYQPNIAGTGSGLLGGQISPQQFYGTLMSMPGYEQVGAQGLGSLLSPSEQKPTGLYMDAVAAGFIPGTPEFQKFIQDVRLRPQTQVNIGDTKPLGAGASEWKNDQGQSPNPMMTISEASLAGFRPQTSGQIKSIEAAQEAAPMFGGMIKYGFGSAGEASLFPPSSKGIIERGISGAQSYLAGVTDSNQRISLYKTNQDAMVTSLAKLSGQVGTLTDRDIDTVKSMLPTPGLTPEPIAKEKFRQIGRLLVSKGVPPSVLKNMNFPDWALPGQGKIARPQTQKDYESIPSGAIYIDPDDGKQYRKP